MHDRLGTRFLRDESGAVAATYALALTGLVVIAGIGFDYGRLATMDSELQNGADQAALAGATQLDGKDMACQRAADAAVSLVTNTTVVANSANTITIANEAGCDAVGTVRFWQNRDGTTAATNDGNARFIELTVAARSVNYVFTPIVALMQGTVSAGAMAGLGSSICKAPPVFMCNPDQANDPNFTVSNYVGKGIRLIANDGGGNYGAGNFGFLQTTGGGGNGPDALRGALGKLEQPGDCLAEDGVTTKTGQNASALDALNTRFDIYSGNTNPVCGGNGAGCPASANSRKDVVHKGNANQCSFSGGNGWQLSANPYIPTSATVPLTNAQADVLSPMGYPRDMCHAISTTGSCSGGIIGNGVWDRNAYFRSHANYGYAIGFDVSATFGTATPTRYQVYKYEAANSATRLIDNNSAKVGPALTARPKAYCTHPGIPVGTAAVDRRVIPMAVINCGAGINGSSGPHDPVAWVDVFLPEPSVRRRVGGTTYTEDTDVYVEVIGATTLGGGGSTASQLIRRDVPYLIR